MLNVVTVQTGNYLGRGLEYVHNLRRQVKRNLTTAHRFYVVTDDVASNYPGCVIKPSMHSGWWEKIRLFKPGMFTGRVLFLDLDTIIVGNIDHIAAYEGRFAILRDFWRPKGLGPAVMLWDPEWAGFIYEDWKGAGFPMQGNGDQTWLEQRPRLRESADILQEMWPDEFASYKTHCTHSLPPSARVVCFHGKPRPHEVGGWVSEYWKELHGLVH